MIDNSNTLNQIRQVIEDNWDPKQSGFDPSKPVLRLHEPTFGPTEIMAGLECMLSTYVTMGEKVKELERRFIELLGYSCGVSCNSGSSANLLAVAALANVQASDHLRPGDEVIVSALSWSTTVWPLIQFGLIPVIVDIDPKTLNIDPNEVEKAIGPKTRAIMPVHVYGNPCDMDALVDICNRHSLVLIEDCCEAMGATYKGKPVGRFGRVGTFSFYFSHHITTLEGGICVTEEQELAELMRILRAHGWLREVESPQSYYQENPDIDERFLFVNLGYNIRLNEVQGAFGISQIEKLNDFIDRRRYIADRWTSIFEPYQDIVTSQTPVDEKGHSWLGYCLTLQDETRHSAAEMRANLSKAGIENRPIICGNIAKQPGLQLYEHRVEGDLQFSSHVMKNGFSIGCHQSLSDEALDYAGNIVRYILG